MQAPILQILQTALGVSVQDRGRPGWRRFGVPWGGVMDAHAATWANRLVDNPAKAAVLEFLLQGGRVSFLADAWVALTGAGAEASIPLWRTVHMRKGDILELPRHCSGVWTYLAVEGGLAVADWLGSKSTYAPAGLGRILQPGDVLEREEARPFVLPSGVATRSTPALEQRQYAKPPVFRVWSAPQTAAFRAEDLLKFFSTSWTVSAQSNRVGYRLTGQPLQSVPLPWSEPMRIGTIQIPDNGQPIVMMRDAPTLGGYPKLGVVDLADLDWLAQCCSGQNIRFMPAGPWPGLSS